jgi:hypothetical protein
LWSVESSLVHVTFWPTLTVVALGEKAMFCILIWTPPLLDDEAAGVEVDALLELLLLLPQPATARATARTAGSASSIRLMASTTPPDVDPS